MRAHTSEKGNVAQPIRIPDSRVNCTPRQPSSLEKFVLHCAWMKTPEGQKLMRTRGPGGNTSKQWLWPKCLWNSECIHWPLKIQPPGKSGRVNEQGKEGEHQGIQSK